MSQLPGGLWRILSLSLVAAEPASPSLLLPQGTLGMAWLRLLAQWWQGAKGPRETSLSPSEGKADQRCCTPVLGQGAMGCISAPGGNGLAWGDAGGGAQCSALTPPLRARSLSPGCSKASNVRSWSPRAPCVIYIHLSGSSTATRVPVALQTLSKTGSCPLPLAMALGFVVLLLVGMMETASRAVPVLTQPAFMLVLPGQTAHLSCILSPQYNISDFGISWFQQRPGHNLTYLLYYNSEQEKHKATKTPDRFSATKDIASNACILTITSICDEDSGKYYCSLSAAVNWF
ncbi:uncharacterized protein LOC136020918 [Lathamus discolor]|uniref:uncharacterized protein LOC136020918 n=1 Tax=Lathamus discolor TaxID=678569 RepID=UPI0032B7BEC0